MKFKFSCACPVNFGGRVCEIAPPPHSCLDIKTREPQAASREYAIQDTSGNFINTYCDFSSEVDFVWTLIETFCLANLENFAWTHFGEDRPRNEDSMNWLDFRLTRNAMNYINQGATHFRATCDFEKDTFDINADYLRGEISKLNFFSDGSDITHTCIEYERVRIFGAGCDNCTAETWHAPGYHAHLEDDSCDLQVVISYNGPRREYFGYFQAINGNHQCSSSLGATTQWWLGVELQQHWTTTTTRISIVTFMFTSCCRNRSFVRKKAFFTYLTDLDLLKPRCLPVIHVLNNRGKYVMFTTTLNILLTRTKI